MQIIEKSIADIRPYENNPRNNEAAIQYVANSIKDFGFKVPIVIDKNGTIITGHTRVLAAKKLGMVPVLTGLMLLRKMVSLTQHWRRKINVYSN